MAGDIDIPDEVRQAVRAAIEAACPTDEQCLADEQECFAAHPIHEAATREGRLESVYADVDGLVDVVLATSVPLLRAQWEADLVAEAAHVAHDQPAEFTAAFVGEWLARQPITLGKPTTVATPSTVILAEDFHEPDEDPADVQAAYDAGEKGVT